MMKKYILAAFLLSSSVSLASVVDVQAQMGYESEAYAEVFRLGLFTGLGWELMGLIFSIVRKMRGGTGME